MNQPYPDVPLVQLHEVGEDPVELSGTSISLVRGIDLGRNSLSIVTKVTAKEYPTFAERLINKWVTLDIGGRREFLGRVTSVTDGKQMQQGPVLESLTPVSIQCGSWWYLLENSLLTPAPSEAVDAVPGFVIKFDEWQKTLKALFSVVAVRGVGYVLERLFALWARIRVPSSITGIENATLADIIRVNWESDPVYGLALNAIGNQLLNNTPASMLSGTFRADPTLVEFYDTVDSLEYRMKPFLFQNVDSARTLKGIREYKKTLKDDKRVNAHFVTTALTTSSRFGDWGFLGGPILDTESILKNGLRQKDHTWPFFPSPKDSNFKQEADKLILRAEAMYREDHLFADGNIPSIRYQDAKPADLLPGEWRKTEDGLVFYVTKTTHSWRLSQQNGAGVVLNRSASCEFTRARFGGYRNLPKYSQFEAPYTALEVSNIA